MPGPYLRNALEKFLKSFPSWSVLALCVCALLVTPGFTQTLGTPNILTVGVNTAPTGVAVADFNGDGKPDLVVTNRGTNNVSVFLGNGDGTFQAAVNTPVGAQPTAVAVGDFNVDGKPDLAVANAMDGTISVLFGNGDGTFTAGATYTVGNNPISIAFGDFLTGVPGAPCLAVVNEGDGTISVLLGKTDGSFFVANTYVSGNTPVWIAASDVNGDGILDLIVENNGDSTVSVFLGEGHGDFALATTSSTGLTPSLFPFGSVAVGDFNTDGKPDLVVANGAKLGAAVAVLLGNGDGTFTALGSYPNNGTPVSVAVADFNADTKLDLAVANLSGDTVSLLLGNGDGTFQSAVNYPTNQVGAVSVAAADLNGDSMPDVAVPNQNSGTVSVLLNVNTPLGANVLVRVLDATTKTSPITVTFSSVTQPGSTTLVTGSTGPAIPPGYFLGNPPTYYNLSTTAAFSGTASVCVNYSTLNFMNSSALHLLHYENTAWVDVTTSVDTTHSLICGSVSSFSPFAVVEGPYAAQIQQPINSDGSSVFSSARGVVPVKFILNVQNVSTCNLPPANIVVTRLSGASAGTVDETVYEMSADSGTSFRISSCQYIYNLDARGLGTGSYEVDLVIDTQVVGQGFFALK